MDVETKMDLIKDFAEEILTEQELKNLFETNANPLAYDGFEPSGIAPIHFGLLRATNLKNMLKAGIKFQLYLADYFAFINNKLGGNLENIKKAGNYFIEVWKACGIDIRKVKVVWASDIMGDIDYWDKVLRVSKEITINRALRATTIMGRKAGEAQYIAQIFYPPMQVTDIFHMDIDICQLGMDQRRAHVLAREIAPKFKWKKPVAVHHHIILGLQGLQVRGTKEETLLASKMSKSQPKTCIYMHETFEELKNKINSAYCPPKIIEGNPLFDYAKYIIFKETDTILIERPAKYGGNLEIQSYDELCNFYRSGKLHPADLKLAIATELNKLIKPAREYFEKNKAAKELYEMVRGFQITR